MRLFLPLIFLLFSPAALVSAEEDTVHPNDSSAEMSADLKREEEPEAEIPQGVFQVEAVIYDHRNSYLKIHWNEGETEQEAEVWSNVNWNHLGGMTKFSTSEGVRYHYLLQRRDEALYRLKKAQKEQPGLVIPTAPASLPKQREGGAQYRITSGAQPRLEAFLSAVHAFYIAEKKTLREAYRVRQYQKKKNFDGHARQRALLSE